MNLPPYKTKGKLQSFLGTVNYMSKLSPMTAEVCKPLWRLTSVKTEWMWHKIYQDICERAKLLAKEDMHEIQQYQEATIFGN